MTATELARHVDIPTARHRIVLLDERRLRCLDCTQTVLLPVPGSSTSTSSSSPIPGPGDPRCPLHEFEHASTCRVCAADQKADQAADANHGRTDPVHQPTADVPARAAEARAGLPTRTPEPRPMPADRERVAAAKAELDAHHAQQTHESNPS